MERPQAGEGAPRRLVREARRRVEERPLVALAIAAGFGFVVGGGVTRGVVTLLLGAGARLAAARIGELALQRGTAPPHQEERS